VTALSTGHPSRPATPPSNSTPTSGALTLAAAFDPRSNAIGFLRWLLAFAVIFSHAGPLADFYGGHDLGTQWSQEQSFGGVAVAGFFCLSGFLITKSRMGRSTIFRFFWRRVLRIFPAFLASLAMTAFILAPIAWRKERGTWAGYWTASVDSPLTYFSNNMFLRFYQKNIAEMGAKLPLGQKGGFDWNGSAWTLIYEFKGYFIVGVLGLFGILGYRKLAAVGFGFMLVLNTMLWGGFGQTAYLYPLFRDYFNIMMLTPFFFGIMLALFGDRIVIDDRLAMAAGGLAFFTYFLESGWNLYGQFGYLYVLIWAAVRLPLRRWEKYGDFSYGIYIYAWPIMQFSAYFGLHTRGWLVYHLVIVVVCHMVAYLSWHLLEKRALALKNWTPVPLARVLARLKPLEAAVTARIVNPAFSSTHAAKAARADAAALAAEASQDDLVTHDWRDRAAAPTPKVGT